MTVMFYLLVASLGVAGCGLALFLWSLRTGQYDDMDGAANRILFDDAEPVRPSTITLRAASAVNVSER